MKNLLHYPLVLLLLLGACETTGPKGDYEEEYGSDDAIMYEIPMTEQPPPMGMMEEYAPSRAKAGGPSGAATVGQPQASPLDTIQKQIIKNARLTYEVKDLKQASHQADSLVKRLGGYISSSNQHNSSQRHELNLILRIPSRNFDALMLALDRLPERIDHKSVEARDVTEQYLDLRSRLETKKKVAKRYQELLQKANTVKEILEVEDKLRFLQEEIEATEGQLRYMTHQVSYSTLHLNLYEVQKYEYLPSRTPHFGQRILGALDGGWQLLQSLTLGLLTIWPFWLLAGLVVMGIRAYRRKGKGAGTGNF
jgi:hypothetical protein